ncbi:MAG TPA: BON domain-containing protein [Acidisarcina sp.]
MNVSAAHRSMHKPSRSRAAALCTALALSVLGLAGCKSPSTPVPQAVARTDQQLANDIQAKISAESALTGQNVQIQVQGGVATLSGAVSDSASRSLAGNDAGTVDGVKTVVNNLSVLPASASASAPPPQLPPAGLSPRQQRDQQRSQQAQAARDQARSDREARIEARRQARIEARQAAASGQQMAASQQPQSAPAYQPPPPPAPESAPAIQAPPPPPPRPAAVQINIPEGTVLPVRISESLDSSAAQVNDVFHGSLAGDVVIDGMVAISRGANVIGRVTDARDAAHFKGTSLLAIELTGVTAHGRQLQLVTDAYTKEGQGRGKSTAEKTGGGAALGAIIGAIAGGGKGAAIGAAAGGGIGAGSNGITRGQQVSIPSETIVNFRLQSPVTVTTSRRVGEARSEEDETPHPTLEQR